MIRSCVNLHALLGVQIDAGAEVIVTQPPLLWNRFETWMNTVQQYVPNSSKLSGQAADFFTVLQIEQYAPYVVYMGGAIHDTVPDFRYRLLGETKLIVGCPMISSAANMKFWLYLCQASNLPEAVSAIKPFSDAAAEGKQSLAAHCQNYNADLVRKVCT